MHESIVHVRLFREASSENVTSEATLRNDQRWPVPESVTGPSKRYFLDQFYGTVGAARSDIGVRYVSPV